MGAVRALMCLLPLVHQYWPTNTYYLTNATLVCVLCDIPCAVIVRLFLCVRGQISRRRTMWQNGVRVYTTVDLSSWQVFSRFGGDIFRCHRTPSRVSEMFFGQFFFDIASWLGPQTIVHWCVAVPFISGYCLLRLHGRRRLTCHMLRRSSKCWSHVTIHAAVIDHQRSSRIAIFIARQYADARYWYSNSVRLSVTFRYSMETA